MYRQIKFRGLRIDGKGWVYGFLFLTTHNTAFEVGLKHCIQQIKKDELTYDTFQVIPESVGQYTGLKDKNGVEIYEGDWLQCPGYCCEVKFVDAGFHTVYKHAEDGETLPIVDISPETSMQVIGNIHQK